MRSFFVRRVPRIVLFAVPTAVAMTLAACGNPLGPRDPQPRRARGDSTTVAQRVLQLVDSVAPTDSSGWGTVSPWW